MTPPKDTKGTYRDGRVIPLVPRTLVVAREATRTTAPGWVSWACLGLGLLCGAGAFYYALVAMRE